MEYKVGDWVEIISHDYCNLDVNEYPIGSMFQIGDVANSDRFSPCMWLFPDGKKLPAILDKSVRPAKNKIIYDILQEL